MDEMSIEQARLKLGEVVDRARIADKFTTITRQGKPAAVVMSVDWLEHTRAALRAFEESDNPAVSADEVRHHVVTLAGLLDGMRKIAFEPDGEFQRYWKQLSAATAELADLLPENAPVTEGGQS
jgi:prevent-host-death family protein